jgi:nicotinate-nucleotide adenylyltransferase
MRIGLFGGTFNPFHSGHLQACRDMITRFFLDRMILIPAAIPPHKPQQGLASPTDRLAMIRLATARFSNMDVSDIELIRPGPSYTVDTLTFFRREYPSADDLFLVMGLDAFLEFHTWKSWQTILKLCAILVMNRPGAYGGEFRDKGQVFDAYVRKRFGYDLSESIDFSARLRHREPVCGKTAGEGAKPVEPIDLSESLYHHPDNRPLVLTPIDSMDISSSRIRQMIRDGQSIRSVVPESVARYISEKGLYQ